MQQPTTYQVRGFKSPSDIIANEDKLLFEIEKQTMFPSENQDVQVDTAAEATDPANVAAQRTSTDDASQQKNFMMNMMGLMKDEKEAMYLAGMLPMTAIVQTNQNIQDIANKLSAYRKQQLTASFVKGWLDDYFSTPKSFTFS